MRAGVFKDITRITGMDLDTRYIMVTKKRRGTRLIERLIPLNKGVKFRFVVDIESKFCKNNWIERGGINLNVRSR